MRPIRLLIVNPNSDPAVTARIRELASRVLGDGVEAAVTDLPGAPAAIRSTADRAIAEPLAIARIEAGVAHGIDAAVLACFDDIAASARGRVPIPIVDGVDASLAIARSAARRFAIVTTFDAAVPRIRALVARHGLEEACAVRAAGIGVGATARLSPATLARLRSSVAAAVHEDGAQAVILGSGALAGRGPVLARGVTCPVIDGIEAAIRLAAASAASLTRCGGVAPA